MAENFRPTWRQVNRPEIKRLLEPGNQLSQIEAKSEYTRQ